MWNWFKLFGRWISCFTSMSCVSWIKTKYILNRIIGKDWICPKLITTENEFEIRNVSMILMQSLKHRKYAPRALCLYIHAVDWLLCNCIYNECIYVCLLPVYREAFLSIVFWNKLLQLIHHYLVTESGYLEPTS